jgi:hypothetical protein
MDSMRINNGKEIVYYTTRPVWVKACKDMTGEGSVAPRPDRMPGYAIKPGAKKTKKYCFHPIDLPHPEGVMMDAEEIQLWRFFRCQKPNGQFKRTWTGTLRSRK